MLKTLTDMPYLAFLLIAFLVWIGARALRSRSIRYRQLYILPSVFLFISNNQLFNTYAFSTAALLAWLTATLAAGFLSWRMAEKTTVKIERDKGRIELPGTKVTLSLILIFIAARLYFGRQLQLNPALRTEDLFTSQILGMTGIVTGYYLGRSGSFLIRYFRTVR